MSIQSRGESLTQSFRLQRIGMARSGDTSVQLVAVDLQHSEIHPGYGLLPARAFQELDVGQPDGDITLIPVLHDLEQLINDPRLDAALYLRLLL